MHVVIYSVHVLSLAGTQSGGGARSSGGATGEAGRGATRVVLSAGLPGRGEQQPGGTPGGHTQETGAGRTREKYSAGNREELHACTVANV